METAPMAMAAILTAPTQLAATEFRPAVSSVTMETATITMVATQTATLSAATAWFREPKGATIQIQQMEMAVTAAARLKQAGRVVALRRPVTRRAAETLTALEPKTAIAAPPTAAHAVHPAVIVAARVAKIATTAQRTAESVAAEPMGVNLVKTVVRALRTADLVHTAGTQPATMERPAARALRTAVRVVPTAAATTERIAVPALRIAARVHTAETIVVTLEKIAIPALKTVAHARTAEMDLSTAQISATTEMQQIAMDAPQVAHTKDAATAPSAAPSSATMETTLTTMAVTQAATLSAEMVTFKVQRDAMILTPRLEMAVMEFAL